MPSVLCWDPGQYRAFLYILTIHCHYTPLLNREQQYSSLVLKRTKWTSSHRLRWRTWCGHILSLFSDIRCPNSLPSTLAHLIPGFVPYTKLQREGILGAIYYKLITLISSIDFHRLICALVFQSEGKRKDLGRIFALWGGPLCERIGYVFIDQQHICLPQFHENNLSLKRFASKAERLHIQG